MNFIDSNHPYDNLNNVLSVLSFLTHSLSLGQPDMDIPLDSTEKTGLSLVLLACEATVEEAIKMIKA